MQHPFVEDKQKLTKYIILYISSKLKWIYEEYKVDNFSKLRFLINKCNQFKKKYKNITLINN